MYILAASKKEAKYNAAKKALQEVYKMSDLVSRNPPTFIQSLNIDCCGWGGHELYFDDPSLYVIQNALAPTVVYFKLFGL